MATSDRVVTRRTSLLREVRKVDPEWDREGKRPVAYRMSNGREFREVEGSSYTDGTSPASSRRGLLFNYAINSGYIGQVV